MSLRLELFVRDIDTTIDFYTRVLGFEPVRKDRDYTSLRRGTTILGIGTISRLPEESGHIGREIADFRRGLGVEIVFEVDNIGAIHNRVLDSGYPIFEPLRERY